MCDKSMFVQYEYLKYDPVLIILLKYFFIFESGKRPQALLDL